MTLKPVCRGWSWALFVSCALFGLSPAASAAEPQSAPPPQQRVRLTARHVGEYAGVPWSSPGSAIAEGSREDRVRDLNFAVSSINLSDEMSEGFLKMWANHARWAREQGKAFLPRVYFWDGRDRFEGPLRDIDVYWKRLDTFLAAMDLKDFTGIVLAEENIHYAGRPAVLRELYRRVKAKYDVDVWQWWSPMRQVPSSGGWIPADGWVIDLYFLPQPEFRRMVRKYLISGKPLVVMPWAAQMDLDGAMTESQWAANTAQLETAVEFNLPVAFFWIHGVSVHFGGDRGAPQTEIARINHWVWNHIDRVRQLPEDYDGLASADRATGDVHEIGPTEGDRLVYFDSFADEKCVDDASMTGFRNFVLDGKELAVRGYRGRAVESTLEYRFHGELAAQHPQVSLDVTVDPTLDGQVELSLSADGKNWISTTSSARGERQTLELNSADRSQFGRLQDFYVRVRITGAAAANGNPVAWIDHLQISSDLAAAQDKQVRLQPVDGNGARLAFDEQFLSQKFRWLADVKDGAHIDWSKGQIGVRMRPGGSHASLVWKVTSPEPVRNIRVRVDGRANPIHLGTHHYLDVSADGKNWRHETNTSGREGDVNGWVRDPLTIDASGDQSLTGVRTFYVRLRMTAGGYEKEHPVLSGVVNRLMIDADAADGQ